MKKLFFAFTLMAVSYVSNAQTAVNTVKIDNTTTSAVAAPVETLGVQETEFNFGKIPQGKPVTHTFTVFNEGKTPFKLDNVQASCGCTTPEWNKENIIEAGKSAEIKVGYNAAAEGPFSKAITITYNGTQSKVVLIKGEVWKTPTTSAPANGAVNDLKQN